MSRTEIISNGSKWYGEAPDSLEVLHVTLAKYRLEPWSHWTYYPDAKTYVFHGNFIDISHVFNITSDDPEIIEQLQTAIKLNLERQKRYELTVS